jgi:hypothetical protein
MKLAATITRSLQADIQAELRDIERAVASGTRYQHAVEIEVYIEEGDAAGRHAAFGALLQQIGTALETDRTLGGLAYGLTYGRPEPTIEAVAGAPAIKTATLTMTVDYESDAPLS